MLTAHIYQCAVCHLRGPQKGCKYRRVRGVRTKVCGPCAERLAQPKPAREDSQPARPTAGGRETRGGRDGVTEAASRATAVD